MANMSNLTKLGFSDEQARVLREYFKMPQKLKDAGIVRSKKILGDIGEFLCTKVYSNLELASQKNQKGYDATRNGKKIQIKFSDSSDAKNINLGNPSEYDEVIVVLGVNSSHRYSHECASRKGKILFYGFTKKEVEKFKCESGYLLSRDKQFKRAEKTLEL